MKTPNLFFSRFISAMVIATLLAAIGILFVCGADITVPDLNGDTNEVTPPKVNLVATQMKTYVGRGIDVFSGPTFASALKSPLLKDVVYVDTNSTGGNSYIDVANVEMLETVVESSVNLTDVYTKLNVGIRVKWLYIPFFSSSFRAQFGSKKTLKSESMFYNSISSTINKKHTLKSAYQTDIESIIDPATLAAINNNSRTPEYLFNAFGTHIIISNGIGGALNISGVYDSDEEISDTDLKAAISAIVFFVPIAGTVSVEYKEKLAKVQSSTSISVHAAGGDVGVFGSPSFENIGDRVDLWTPTISNNATLSIIYQTIPIWELATDSMRKAQIEGYFYDRAITINAELDNYFTKSAKPKEPIVVDGGVYAITNWDSQRTIDATHSEWEECVYRILGICSNYDTKKDYRVTLRNNNPTAKKQQWDAVEANGQKGVFSFKSMGYTDRSLHVPTNLTDRVSTEITDRSQNNQKFTIIDNSDGSVFLRSVLDTAYYLSVKTESQPDGTLIYLDKDTTLARAKWKFTKVDEIDPTTRKKQLASN